MSDRQGSASLDFVFASFIFILILGYSVVAYSESISSLRHAEKTAKLEAGAYSISEAMVKSKGYPENWEDSPSDAKAIGLAESENVLSTAKVSALHSMDEMQAKEIMGIANDYLLQIESVDGQVFFAKGSINQDAGSVSIERIVYYNQSACKLVVRLYE